MNWNKLFIITKHLFFWVLSIFILRSFDLKWGWTISTAYDTLIPQSYGALTNAAVFYGTSFYLIPRFFNTHRKRLFYAYSVGLLLGVSLIEMAADQYFGNWYQNQAYLIVKELPLGAYILEGLIYILPINLFYYIIAFVYRIPFARKQMPERELQLQREKLEAELKFLKAQIHPHTLFNGLNSIYHLIDFDPPKAKELIVNLSNALRYQLYESSGRFVPLDKEVAYLQQYIALQEVRIDEDAVVEVSFPEAEAEYLVAPLIFTPFIENAFKYISHHPAKEDNKIGIRFAIEQNTLIFECVNTVDADAGNVSEPGGIGLENVQNRLRLLYQSGYKLELKKGKGEFVVKLLIPLTASK